LIVLVLLPGIVLDLIYGGFPKPGRVAGFGFGMIFGGLYSIRDRNGRLPRTSC
jgi:hypothetical protein